MERLVKQHWAFMTVAFEGPAEYRGRDLRSAHAHLVKNKGLSDVHFDRVVRALEETLVELGVAEDLRREVLDIVGATRDEVLDR
jgi:hemoglobin